MKKLLFSILCAISLCLLACSEKELPADANDAAEQGRADARALCDANYTTDSDLHAALLAVKAREWEMRRSGDSIGASAYISAFKQELKETDHNLARKVL